MEWWQHQMNGENEIRQGLFHLTIDWDRSIQQTTHVLTNADLSTDAAGLQILKTPIQISDMRVCAS
jgi:hypothetical protein